jgi:heme/copper-type cytochrome/quinol oxidase subunit 2
MPITTMLSIVLVVVLVLVTGLFEFEDEDEEENEDDSWHRSTATTCSTISSGVKFRFQPSRPLAQNVQP